MVHGGVRLCNILLAKVSDEDDIRAKVKIVDCNCDLAHTEQYMHLESVS